MSNSTQLIREYAIDPESINTISKIDHIISRFGLDRGRVISMIRRNWIMKVIDSFSGKPVERQSFVNRCSKLQPKEKKRAYLVRNYRTPNSNDFETWLDLAEAFHEEIEFSGIFSHENPNQKPYIIDLLEDEWYEHPCFEHHPSRKISKDLHELVRACKILLLASEKIILVDPYFDPKREKWRKILVELLSTAKQINRKVTKNFRVVLSSRPTDMTIESEKELRQKVKESPKYLTKIKPSEINLEVFGIRRKKDLEKPHDRFLLSELGGISSTYGWDPNYEGNQSTYLGLLSIDDSKTEWLNYQENIESNFDLIESISIP